MFGQRHLARINYQEFPWFSNPYLLWIFVWQNHTVPNSSQALIDLQCGLGQAFIQYYLPGRQR